MSAEHDRVTLVLGVIQDDIRHVQVRATAALAVAAVFVTQIPLADLTALPDGFQWLTWGAILVLAAAGVSYFHYTQLLNRQRLAIAKAYPSASSALDMWERRFMDEDRTTSELRWYLCAQWLFAAGAGAVAIVLGELLVF